MSPEAVKRLTRLWNAGSVGDGTVSGRPSTSAPLAAVVREPLAELGSADPDLDASLVAHAVVGALSDHLWHRTRPTRAEIDHIVAFCLRIPGGDLRAARRSE